MTEGYGPDEDLLARIDLAAQAPPTPGEPFEEVFARRDRLVAARSVTDLSAADQEWLNARIAEVHAGLSNTFQSPESWGGDWAAEDAALEAGHPIPVADLPEGPADDVAGVDDEVELALYDDTADTPAEAKALSGDDDGWVG